MRKFQLLVVAAVSVVFVACKKDAKCPYSDSNVVAPQTEIDSLQRYVDAQGITAVKDVTGVFYVLSGTGSGAAPDVCSTVSVEYQGYLLSNTSAPFDGTQVGQIATFTLGQTIEGWRKGIPKAKAGNSITLFIPPSLGYGSVPRTNSAGVTVIPANSYLKFTVNLLQVN